MAVTAACMGPWSSAAFAQLPQSWTAASLDQNFGSDWSWMATGQLRTPMSVARWNRGIVDLRLGRSWSAVPNWSLDGTWRTGWEWPQEGGGTTTWRWATSLKWKKNVAKHKLRLRLRHQFGGAWLRSWDRARWRVQAKWTHDLPKGWKVVPAVEGFWGRKTLFSEGALWLEPSAIRGRISFDKKVAKRRHVVVGYQVQSPVMTHPDVIEHTVLLSLEMSLKKPKSRRPKVD